MKRKGLNFWWQTVIFMIVSSTAFISIFAIVFNFEEYKNFIIIGLFFVVLIIFLCFIFLPIILDKFRPFRLSRIYFDYINIKKIVPSMKLPEIMDIELAYFIGAHVWVIQDTRIIVQTYILKWIQEGYLEQVRDVQDYNNIKLVIKENEINSNIVTERELFNFIKEMPNKENEITTLDMEKWFLNNKERMQKWFQLLYSINYNKALKKLGVQEEITLSSKKPKANEELIHYAKTLMALKNFLKDYSILEERMPVEVHLWDEYMLYASLFGITDIVEKKLKNICPESINYNKNRDGLDLVREIGIGLKRAKISLKGIIKKYK
ncbi:MAG: DUF2207 domain-containing protein [Clostridia bacterium]|nr:DUF2207 domain-containing protein [Clostridia bacterium]